MLRPLLFFSISIFCIQSQALTLDAQKIYERYLSHSPGLKAARERLSSAEALEVEAGRKLFPSLSLVGAVTDQKTPKALTGGFDLTPPKVYNLSVSFKQPLYMGGKIWRAWEMRKLSARRAALDLRGQQIQDVFELLKTALSLEMQVQFKKEIVESQLTQGQFLEIIRRRHKRGAAKAYEKFQAEADLLSYEGQLIEADQTIFSLEQYLRQELNISGEESVKVSINDIMSKEVPDLEKGLKEALNSRADYRQALLNEEVAKNNKWLELGDHLPQVVLEGQVGYTSIDQEVLTDSASEMRSITLSVAIPFFSGLSSVYTRRSVESQITAARHDIKALENQIYTDVKDAFDNISRSRVKLDSAKEWKNKSELALQEGVKNYKVGIISSLVVVQLQKAREMAAKAYWAALSNLKVSKLRWRLARGLSLSDSQP